MEYKIDVEGKFFRSLQNLVDAFLLGLLWIICCIPIVTIGAASTALYYTVHKSLRQNRGYTFKCFFASFKNNFKQSTISWLVVLAVSAVLFVDMGIFEYYLIEGASWGWAYYLFLISFIGVMVWSVYLFAYIARFENGIVASFKNAAIFAIVNIRFSLLIIVVMVLIGVVFFYATPALIILPSLVCMVFNRILEHVFRKYMTEEDEKKEKELDMFLK